MLVDEIAFVREKMDVESDIRKKVYYYSAVHAMVQRVLNIDPNFDQQLVFMFSVLSASYSQMRARADQIVAGDRMITPPENFFDRISTYLQELEGSCENLSMVEENYSMDLEQYRQMVASALESMQ